VTASGGVRHRRLPMCGGIIPGRTVIPGTIGPGDDIAIPNSVRLHPDRRRATPRATRGDPGCADGGEIRVRS